MEKSKQNCDWFAAMLLTEIICDDPKKAAMHVSGIADKTGGFDDHMHSTTLQAMVYCNHIAWPQAREFWEIMHREYDIDLSLPID